MRIYLITCIMMFLLAFTDTDPNPLIGKWETKPSDGGNITAVIFKDNNEFESYINSTAYINGTYTVKGKVISITDDRCGDITGTYEMIFFSHSDSLRFQAIDDECGRRKFAIENTILGRVKK